LTLLEEKYDSRSDSYRYFGSDGYNLYISGQAYRAYEGKDKAEYKLDFFSGY
jgi:hypothetical protein